MTVEDPVLTWYQKWTDDRNPTIEDVRESLAEYREVVALPVKELIGEPDFEQDTGGWYVCHQRFVPVDGVEFVEGGWRWTLNQFEPGAW